jgi:hypothetical protein
MTSITTYLHLTFSELNLILNTNAARCVLGRNRRTSRRSDEDGRRNYDFTTARIYNQASDEEVDSTYLYPNGKLFIKKTFLFVSINLRNKRRNRLLRRIECFLCVEASLATNREFGVCLPCFTFKLLAVRHPALRDQY